MLKKINFKFGHYLKNISWMMGERVSTLIIGLLLSIFLAREIGADNYGLYSYGLSIVTILSVIAQFGLNGIVIRDLSKGISPSLVLSNVIVLRAFFTLMSLLILFIIAIYSESVNERNVIIAFSGVVIFTVFDVFDYWFQSQVQYKYVTLSRLISTVIGSTSKVLVVLLGFDIISISIIHSLSLMLFSCLLIWFFLKKIKKFKLIFDVEMMKNYLREAYQVFLGSFFSIVYLKIDQVMINHEIGSTSVGYYAIASQLSEAWYFIPVAIVATLFPSLVKIKDNPELYERKFQTLLDLLFSVSLLVSIFIFMLAEPLIDFIYGDEYLISAKVLEVHIFSGLFVFMRAAFSRWIIIERQYFFSILTQGLGALVNIILNLIFIKKFGVIGAAYATLISYMIASYLSLFFYKKTRCFFYMMTKAIILPFRFLIILLKR